MRHQHRQQEGSHRNQDEHSLGSTKHDADSSWRREPRDDRGRFQNDGHDNRGSSDSDGQLNDEDSYRGTSGRSSSRSHVAYDSEPGYGGRSDGARLGEGDRGVHAGKGPKGYRRSDDRIKEDVSEALTRHGEVDASDLEVGVDNGDVTLSGTVPDKKMKRLAEECADGCSGVDQVQNNIRHGKRKHEGSDEYGTGSAKSAPNGRSHSASSSNGSSSSAHGGNGSSKAHAAAH